MRDIELIDVEPIDEREAFVFENRGPDYRTHTSGMRRVSVYPKPCAEAEGLRDLRIRHRVTLGQAARALGLATSDVSGLECGRRRPVDSGDWGRIHDAIRALEVTDG